MIHQTCTVTVVYALLRLGGFGTRDVLNWCSQQPAPRFKPAAALVPAPLPGTPPPSLHVLHMQDPACCRVMSSPAGPVRRSTRSGAAASSPVSESPVPSNPLADDGPKSSPPAQHVPAAKSSSGSRKPSGSPSAVLLLAVLLISGGIMYNQWSQQQAAAADAAAAEAAAGERDAAVASTPHRSALEQEAVVGQEAPAEEDEPPPPPMTAEEVAVFELAAGEHYGSPPGFQLPDFQEEVEVSSEEEEQAEQHDQEVRWGQLQRLGPCRPTPSPHTTCLGSCWGTCRSIGGPLAGIADSKGEGSPRAATAAAIEPMQGRAALLPYPTRCCCRCCAAACAGG